MKKKIAIILSLLLCVNIFPMDAQAAIKSAGEPTEVESLISGENLEHNFVKVTAMGEKLRIEVETPIKAERFSVSVRGVQPQTSSNYWCTYVTPVKRDGYYSFEATIPNYVREGKLNGTYVLCITMPPKDTKNKSDMFYKNCNFKVENGQFSILEYGKIKAENLKQNKTANKVGTKKFKAADLSDLKTLCFRDPVTKKVAPVTAKKVKYFKTVSDKVVMGAESDYDKLLKIYEYIAESFYYDDIAFQTGTKQYVDPYRNLYNLRNKKKSANSEKGKVATTCVGYAAAVAALARAQGIPTRIVNGHHVGMGKERYNNWTTEENISKMDHWWAECYVDGRWITVDATPGNSNKWNRTTNKWTYTGLTNYIYFDPTAEQLATSHMILETKGVK